MSAHVLAIDEGGTGVRAYVFDGEAHAVASSYVEIALMFPRPGWVEHDPMLLWDRTLDVARAALAEAGVPATEVAGVGVANQRASAIVWDAESGAPIYPAIGWQDLRTIETCAELNRRGHTFSPMQTATKFAWIVDNVPGARARADRGQLRFGTIDTWIGWCLSKGEVYVTDASNASCTGLYDFFSHGWDTALLESLRLPAESMPAIVPSSHVAGVTDSGVLGAPIPLGARAGDQQAAMFGQLRLEPGMAKITYGTAAMMDLNVGRQLHLSPHGVFPLVLWGLGDEIHFCLEGSAITAGAAVQWLRDGLGVIDDPNDAERLATSIADTGGAWCVPAFQGLGTPYLEADARALLGGLSRGTGRAEIVRAVLEGVAFRCLEVHEALRADSPFSDDHLLRADGGAARNDFLLQFHADVERVAIERAAILDAAALGVAYLAGLAGGVWHDTAELAPTWRRDRLFEPRMSADERAARVAAWKARVGAARTLR